MHELEYPFDSAYIMKKKKSLKRALLSEKTVRVKKKIAVLGGSTTSDIVSAMELFLLNVGIEPEFYQSEYARYWQDAVFGNEELDSFAPDLVYVHTSNRNIESKIFLGMSREEIDSLLEQEAERYQTMWDCIANKFHCPIIQNNFELPSYRLLGNSDTSDYHGRVNFITRLNCVFYEKAQSRSNLYINDINWLSAQYGLEKWSAPEYWYMYKYSLNINAIPQLSYQVCSIIKSIFGKNKKALALDLDNTLWGGIVGDDGAENLKIGQETSEAQAYYEFQQYVKSLKDIGVLLTVCSKNEEENALAGLNHPEGAVKPEDFIVIKANWNPKNLNLEETANSLNILPEAIVFADDNPAEREIVRAQTECAVPEIGQVTDYIRVLDRSEFFEVTSLSADDLKRNDMYKANIARESAKGKFASYGEYLLSLEMTAEIQPFNSMYIQRITQLTNKSNQFNLTTRRYTQTEMEEISASENYLTLYGKLGDRFGDNGVVSVIVGEKKGETLNIDLWLMSCRVLKRDMELAMLDCLVSTAREQGISRLKGVYIPSPKNKMVKNFYPETLGFSFLSEDETGASQWELNISEYENKNKVIKIVGGKNYDGE